MVTCRAVKSVRGLLELIGPGERGHMRRSGGSGRGDLSHSSSMRWREVLAIKGDKAGQEIAEADSLLGSWRLRAEVVKPLVAGITVGTVVRISHS